MNKYWFCLDMSKDADNHFPYMFFRQGEENLMEINLVYSAESPDAGEKESGWIDLTGCLVTLHLEYSNGQQSEKMLIKKDSMKGQVEWCADESDVEIPGMVEARIRIYHGNAEPIESEPFTYDVIGGVVSAVQLQAKTQNQVADLLARMNTKEIAELAVKCGHRVRVLETENRALSTALADCMGRIADPER